MRPEHFVNSRQRATMFKMPPVFKENRHYTVFQHIILINRLDRAEGCKLTKL